MKNGKILVTGADGFIGSHLAETLVTQGYDVKAFVLYNSFNDYGWLENSPYLKDMEIHQGDIRDAYGVREAMKGCSSVFHLAALIAIPYSYYSPETYLDTNAKGTLNMVQAARDLEIDKIVCTSTSEVYGTAQYVPMDEAHPLEGQSPYSASKIAADQMAMSFYKSFETPVAIARPFNTFGPRQSARAVIPTIISQIANGYKQIKLGDTTPTRDFTFVEDTANGLIAIGKSEQTIGRVTNLGSGFEISIGELATTIAQVMDSDIEIIQEEERLRPEKSEVKRLFANIDLAKEILDWDPQHQGFEGFKKGMEITAKWFCDPENLKRYKADQYVV